MIHEPEPRTLEEELEMNRFRFIMATFKASGEELDDRIAILREAIEHPEKFSRPDLLKHIVGDLLLSSVAHSAEAATKTVMQQVKDLLTAELIDRVKRALNEKQLQALGALLAEN